MYKIIISDDCGNRGPTHFAKIRLRRTTPPIYNQQNECA